MIVKCASCQTRFKIADDKVTDKGVKVRCTKCGTVFTVSKADAADTAAPVAEAAPPPPPPAAKRTGAFPPPRPTAASTPLSDLLGADLMAQPAPGTVASLRTSGVALGVASGVASKPPPAPRMPAAPLSRPPPAPPPEAMDDPFSAFMGGPQAVPPDPSGPGLMPGEFALPDLPPASQPPLAPPAATSAEDLLGLGAGWPAPPPLPSPSATGLPPLPSAFDAALDPLGGIAASPGPTPDPGTDPFGNLPSDPFGDLPAPASAPAAAPAQFGAEFDAGSFDPLAGLSLDPAAIPGDGAGPELPGSAEPTALFDMSQKPLNPDAGVAIGVLGAKPKSQPPAPPAEAGDAEETLARAREWQERLRKTQLQRAELHESARTAVPEEKSLAARVFNALAGASVILLALLAFIAYRSGGRLDLHDPLSVFFRAFGVERPVPASLSLPTEISGSGFYPTLHGESVLFVRGTVKNLTVAPAQVSLKLEVQVDGHTVASADGVAGVLPTPEEIYEQTGAAAPKAKGATKDAPPAADPATAPADVEQPAAILPGKSAEFLLIATGLPESVRSGSDHADLLVAARTLPGAVGKAPAGLPPPAPIGPLQKPASPGLGSAPAPAAGPGAEATAQKPATPVSPKP